MLATVVEWAWEDRTESPGFVEEPLPNPVRFK
jgi:hypothetical protein